MIPRTYTVFSVLGVPKEIRACWPRREDLKEGSQPGLPLRIIWDLSKHLRPGPPENNEIRISKGWGLRMETVKFPGILACDLGVGFFKEPTLVEVFQIGENIKFVSFVVLVTLDFRKCGR